MKKGDLVKQAPNKWADREIGNKPMIVTLVRNTIWQDKSCLEQDIIVDVFVNHEIKTFHLTELEIVQ